MRRRRPSRKRPPPSLGDLCDPRGFAALGERFLQWNEVHGYTTATIYKRRKNLLYFFRWARERGLQRPAEVSRGVLERYQRHMYFRHQGGRPLSMQTQASRLVSLRAYFRWLARDNHILFDPSAQLQLPRFRHRLPRDVLSAEEAEAVMARPELSNPFGVRDRAILETLYSTGMRRGELIGLEVPDVDLAREVVVIRTGKSRRDRLIPLGKRASLWVDKYLREVWPEFADGYETRRLFISSSGNALLPGNLTKTVARYITAALGAKRGSCHLLRHSMATQMLRGGADIRYIQQMLGHEDLGSTEVYTHLSIEHLQEVHRKTHPAEGGRSAEALRDMQPGGSSQAEKEPV